MRTAHLIALLGATTLFGCSDTTAPNGDSNAAPINFMSPLTLSTRLGSPVLAQGGSVTMTLTITNVSNKSVTATTNTCPSRFAISTRDGQTVDRGNPICTLMLSTATLAPGESVSLTESWDGMELVGRDAVTRAPAGEYVIRGSEFGGPVRSNAAAELTILP